VYTKIIAAFKRAAVIFVIYALKKEKENYVKTLPFFKKMG